MLSRQRFTAASIGEIQSRLLALIGRRGQRLDDLRHRLESAISQRVRARAAQVANFASRIERQNPSVRLALARRRLERAEQTLDRLAGATISVRARRLDHAGAQLQALSPLAVLNRGYAIVYSSGGQVVRDAADVNPGESIRARLAKGSVNAEVRTVESV